MPFLGLQSATLCTGLWWHATKDIWDTHTRFAPWKSIALNHDRIAPTLHAVTGRRMIFDVVNMVIGIGPWSFTIPFKAPTPIKDVPKQEAGKLPFFLYAYVDKGMVVARGRSGGLAVWVRGESDWAARSGVMAVYK
jgi:hypothetical protein